MIDTSFLPAAIGQDRFKLGQDRGNLSELTERHRSLRGEPCQRSPRRRKIGFRFSLEQEQRDLRLRSRSHPESP